MNKDKLFFDLEPEDFIIRIHPNTDENNKWTGEVVVGIVTAEENELNDHDYAGMLQFTNMLCSCVAMMEEDEGFREAILEYYESEQNKHTSDTKKHSITKEPDSNIVRINFNTKVDGSA